MSAVWSCNEWDPLEEVIIGNPFNAKFPTSDKSFHLAEFFNRNLEDLPTGDVPQRIIEETEEDLSEFVDVLVAHGVTVKRPITWPHQSKFSTINWEATGFSNYNPRDILLVVADNIIESPNVIRSRLFETFSYRDILLQYMLEGAKWISAPRPMLLDQLYDVENIARPVPRNIEPVFDAANILRFGRDLLYLVSSTGNEMGGQWLQTILGSNYKVHLVRNVYDGSHVDTTFVALRNGLVLCNPARVNEANMPDFLRQWEILYCPPLIQKPFDTAYLSQSIACDWIDMNLFSISPNTVVVDKWQNPLIKLLEKRGFTVIPLELRHSRFMGGGFHCVTLDTRRSGTLENYFG